MDIDRKGERLSSSDGEFGCNDACVGCAVGIDGCAHGTAVGGYVDYSSAGQGTVVDGVDLPTSEGTTDQKSGSRRAQWQ